MRLGSDGGGEGVLVGGQEPAHGVDGGALDLRLLVLGVEHEGLDVDGLGVTTGESGGGGRTWRSRSRRSSCRSSSGTGSR